MALVDEFGIDVVAILDDFVVQVRSGRESGSTDLADDLFLLYELPCANQYLAQVRVASAIAIGMDDFDQFAVTAFPASERDLSAGRSPHQSARRRTIVRT